MKRDKEPVNANEGDDDRDDELDDDLADERPRTGLAHRIVNWAASWMAYSGSEPLVRSEAVSLPPWVPGVMPDDFQPDNVADDEPGNEAIRDLHGDNRPLTLVNTIYTAFMLPFVLIQMVVFYVMWQIDDMMKNWSNKRYRK